MSYSQPYTWQERNQLLENVRLSREIVRPHNQKHDAVKPLVDKLCGLIEKHDFIPSEDWHCETCERSCNGFYIYFGYVLPIYYWRVLEVLLEVLDNTLKK